MAELSDEPVFTVLLGTLLPGSGSWPSAGDTQALAFLARRAEELPAVRTALNALRALLPADFASRDLTSRTAALREAEERIPQLFAQVVDEAYRGYYTDPLVLALIERKTGYPAGPPQPRGRKVRPTDWSVLAGRGIAPAPPSSLPNPEKSHGQ